MSQSSGGCEEFLFKSCSLKVSCFSLPNLFFPLYTIQCAGHVHSLSIIDHVFGVRLDTLKHDYLLVPEPSSHRIKKSCTMLHSSVFPLDCVENDCRVLPELAHVRDSREYVLLLVTTIFPLLQRAENSDSAIKYEQLLDASSAPRSSWQAVGQPDALTWKLSGTQGTSAFWESLSGTIASPNA